MIDLAFHEVDWDEILAKGSWDDLAWLKTKVERRMKSMKPEIVARKKIIKKELI